MHPDHCLWRDQDAGGPMHILRQDGKLDILTHQRSYHGPEPLKGMHRNDR